MSDNPVFVRVSLSRDVIFTHAPSRQPIREEVL